MKKILFFIILLLMASEMNFAQRPFQERPFHPVNPQIGQPRILVDTVFAKCTWGENFSETSAFIERSKDGLRDTFYYTHHYTNPLTEIIVHEYDADNRLISIKSKILPAASFYVLIEYEYDSSGRLTRLAEWSLPGVFESYDYSTIVYTDSSYILNDIEYVFDAEDRLIRAGEITYSYFENGYSENLGPYAKTIYYFLENGYLSKKIFYKLFEEEWIQHTVWETAYRYKADNPNNPNSNATIKNTLRKVYGIDGAVMIYSGKPETVRIYAVSGLIVRNIQTSPGNQSISLSKGFYIVKMGDQAYKVMVR